jgi:hypothetical protein
MASAEFDIGDIWTAAGIILGFQINALLRRVQRQAAAGDQLSDRSRSEAGYRLNGFSIADLSQCTCNLCHIIWRIRASCIGDNWHNLCAEGVGFGYRAVLGLSIMSGRSLQTFGEQQSRSFSYFPYQEKVTIAIFATLAIVFIVLAIS